MTHADLPTHLQQPHLRRIQPIPGQDPNGRPIVHLRDPFMLAMDRMLAIPMPAMQAVQMFDGSHRVEDIATALKRPVSDITSLVENMDNAGLLWGPTCERMEKELHDKLQQMGHYPMRQSRVLGEDPETARGQLRTWISETEDPEVDGPIRGLIVPRLDYSAMWPVYAGAYHTVRHQTIQHVLLLGCNQAGLGAGVIISPLGFQSPLGIQPADTTFIAALERHVGDLHPRDHLDHITEHGPEMQIPWIQECIGADVPVTAVLVPDPLAPDTDEDAPRISHDDFVRAAQAVIGEVDGDTLVIACADLSYVGPQAGEPRPVDDQRRFDVERTDRDLLAHVINGESRPLLEEIERTHNPTHWSGLGPITMLLDILRPQRVELIDYRQMILDEQKLAMLSDACLALA